jgi:transposase
VLLAGADGAANARTAREVGVSVSTVREWHSRFEAEGLAKFGEARKGRGRKPTIAQEKIERSSP